MSTGSLPAPPPTVSKAFPLLPHAPGVYLFRDRAGRVVYVGRSRDLARRVRSYWVDLGDRHHLVRMVRRVEWVEPVVCASEHEAAFLESDLMERHRTPYNRSLGMESMVWLRLDSNPVSPSLEVRHDVDGEGGSWFGPYLGWEPARQAAAALHRLFPIRFAGSGLSRSDRELARSLGVVEGEVEVLARGIERVLRREPQAVRSTLRTLERWRDAAARDLMFERAQLLQDQIRSLRWICEPQKLAGLRPVDGDFRGEAGSTVVVLALRRGRLWQRHVMPGGDRSIGTTSPGADPEWLELAAANAQVMRSLAAANALGPLGWRPLRS